MVSWKIPCCSLISPLMTHFVGDSWEISHYGHVWLPGEMQELGMGQFFCSPKMGWWILKIDIPICGPPGLKFWLIPSSLCHRHQQFTLPEVSCLALQTVRSAMLQDLQCRTILGAGRSPWKKLQQVDTSRQMLIHCPFSSISFHLIPFTGLLPTCQI